jgi:hypothetical protein
MCDMYYAAFHADLPPTPRAGLPAIQGRPATRADEHSTNNDTEQ